MDDLVDRLDTTRAQLVSLLEAIEAERRLVDAIFEQNEAELRRQIRQLDAITVGLEVDR